MERRGSRKTCQRLRVPVYPDEKKIIEENAASACLPVAVFLRNLALGYVIKSKLDNKLIFDLIKVNADLGRLGGLLKLWLTDDEKLATYNKVQLEATIHGALDMILKNQEEMSDLIKSIKF